MFIGEDIDFIILLLTLTPYDSGIIFKKPGKEITETSSYSIKNVLQQVKVELSYFLFIHAIGGCDTISAMLNKGNLNI